MEQVRLQQRCEGSRLAAMIFHRFLHFGRGKAPWQAGGMADGALAGAVAVAVAVAVAFASQDGASTQQRHGRNA